MPRIRTWLCLLFAATPLAPAAAQSAFPSDSAIREIARQVIPVGGEVGVVVGLLEADGSRRIVTAGEAPWDGRTLFEIGSITKTFTAVLLAEMAERGEVRLDQPVAELLPDSVRVPSRGGEITLAHLSTHASGLPRMPDNFEPADWRNPFADYTVERLYGFLGSHTLRRDVGAAREYSNLGVGLLGHALALRSDTSYEALARERILAPLGMSMTMIGVPDSFRPLLAPGHNTRGDSVANWDIPTLAGAGALLSNTDDMLTWIEAHLSPPPEGPLGRAIRRVQSVRSEWGETKVTGLGWGIGTTRFGRPIVSHNGGTGGYRSLVAFDPERRIGVVVLSNQARDVDRIGAHLLEPRTPLSTADLERGFAWMAMVLAALLVLGVFFAWRRTGAPRRKAVRAAVLTAAGVAAWHRAVLAVRSHAAPGVQGASRQHLRHAGTLHLAARGDGGVRHPGARCAHTPAAARPPCRRCPTR